MHREFDRRQASGVGVAPRLTRRALLGAAAATLGYASSGASAQNRGTETAKRFFLTPEEEAILTRAVDRILPADEWPSASEAGVVDFIDYQLATAWGRGEGLFRQGPHQAGAAQQGYQLPHAPAELFRAALAHEEMKRLPSLSTQEADAVLARLQKNEIRLGDIPGGAFFTVLRQSTLEGYFSDPIHNGNRGLAGWRMIGFPGAHAYYLTEVDRFDMDYRRPPSGVGHRPGVGEPARLAAPAQPAVRP